ncbi:hypothetical protein ACP4OV_029020 [Aristida adscensionis]
MEVSDAGEVTGGRPSEAAAAPLEVDDILGQILLRLPPRPSSLPRAAAVCRRWRRLVSSPHFRRGFLARHRKPPLLGLLTHDSRLGTGFTPALDPPDRIPAGRFARPGDGSVLIGCRHGRALFLHGDGDFVAWEPFTGDQRVVAVPPELRGGDRCGGAIICAAGDQDHIHGACQRSPFQVVVVGRVKERMLACVYSSETNAWGNPVSILWPSEFMFVHTDSGSTLVGNSVYWLIFGEHLAILQFDLDRQSLAILDAPQDAIDMGALGLGFLNLSGFTAELWKRKVNSDGSVRWVLRNFIQLNSLLQLAPWVDPPILIQLVEEENAMILCTHDDVVFMVHLESSEFERIPEKKGLLHLSSIHMFLYCRHGDW